jgi:hypothetical protein
MRLVVLKDRRPGEFRKALGLAAVIARMVPAVLMEVDTSPRRFARNQVRLWALKRDAAGSEQTLHFLYGISAGALGRMDIVIGAGRPTAAAGILLKRLTGAKFVYAGYLRDYDPADIDLMLVGSPRQALEPKCQLAPIPTLIEPQAFSRPRSLISEADLHGAVVSLILGGSRSGYTFSEADWQAIGSLVSETGTRYGIRWRVANSRRTPVSASNMLRGMAQRSVVEQFIDVAGPGWPSADQLFGADAVVVTEDSLTMIAEGLSALRPVIALKPQGGLRHGYPEELCAMVCGEGLRILPIRSAFPDVFCRTLLSLTPPQTDPRDVIAAAIAPRLGLKVRE